MSFGIISRSRLRPPARTGQVHSSDESNIMRKFKIPNMGALVAFEAAARHESFTHAAKELFLTESAVSRQIATLEASLGVRLFARVKQRVVLTRAGKLYGTQVRRALEALDRDTLSIIAHGSGGGYLGSRCCRPSRRTG